MSALVRLFSFILLFSPLSPQVFAADECDVKNFGAKGDGKTKDTVAIQAAIDACAKTGGKVILSDGLFLSGMITLKSNITLYIDESARLKGSWTNSDYPKINVDSNNSQLADLQKALVHANKAENITIEGKGTIDGNGDKLEWRIPWITESKRPMAIFIAQSKGVLIQDVHIKDSAMWTLVTLESDDVVIRGVSIDSPHIPNRDGIDIVDGRNILIENNTIKSQDDSICLKSGSEYGLENVIVRNNKVVSSSFANGLKMGTASVGSFKNIIFENIEIDNANLAAMAVESIDGAIIENVIFDNIKIKKSGTPFFVILGSRKGNTRPIGSIEGVHFRNIIAEKSDRSWGSAISGTVKDGVRHAPKNITFSNVTATFLGDSRMKTPPESPDEYEGQYPDPHMWGQLPASGIYFRHIDGLKMQNTKLYLSRKGDPRPIIVKEDVRP